MLVSAVHVTLLVTVLVVCLSISDGSSAWGSLNDELRVDTSTVVILARSSADSFAGENVVHLVDRLNIAYANDANIVSVHLEILQGSDPLPMLKRLQAHREWKQFYWDGNPVVIVSRLLPEDRSCLLTPVSTRERKNVIISSNFEAFHELLHAINDHLVLYRDAEGNNSELGEFAITVKKRFYIPQRSDKCAIEDMAAMTEERFLFEYVLPSKPVVFRGGASHWPAMHKWSDEYIVQQSGDPKVHIQVGQNSEFEGCEDVSLWNSHAHSTVPEAVREKLPFPDLVVVRPAVVDMRISDFIEHMGADTQDASFYLEYSSLKSTFRNMEDDVVRPPLLKYLQLLHQNVWFGNGKTVGKLHFDQFDNFLVQVKGEKHLILFPPHNNTRLYEGHIREARLAYSLDARSFARTDLQDSTAQVMSPVNLEHPNLQTFPLFENASKEEIRCSIGPGDVLYLPSYWWHEVRSKPDGDNRNIAVNYWYEPVLEKDFPCPTCGLEIRGKGRQVLERYWDTWRENVGETEAAVKEEL